MILSEKQAERYSRHFVLREIGVKGQKRLLSSRVLVIGAGGLGSSALMYLAAAGIGTIGIADYDCVDLSNLQRQIIHGTERIGMKKTESASRTIKELNPDVDVKLYSERITTENILNIIDEYDFIIDGTDRFESKFLINDACVLSQKPYSHAGVVRFEGQAMTYVPKKGPCLRCLLDRVPPAEQTMTCSQAGVLGSVTGILGSIQASEAIKYLLGAGELLMGRVLRVDALSMRIQTVNIGKNNNKCRICGSAPEILSLSENKNEYEINGCGHTAGEN
ncbi:MAG: HesA/MoeB/ThiF family protein [Oscillospiraceae bacterium]|nr:HesA/MoeB/ThiF family protein [Oscillospiraceae bacterium]